MSSSLLRLFNTTGVGVGSNPDPLLANLAALWGMDAASGDEPDLIGANTAIDETTTASTTGQLGNCRSFASDYLRVADSADVSMGAGARFSVAVWFRPTDLTGVTTVFAKRDAGGDIEYWLRSVDGALNFAVSSDGTIPNIAQVTHGTTLNVDMWYLAVAVYDGAELQLSLNGGAFATTAFSGDVANTTRDLIIGAYEAGTGGGDIREHWVGLIDLMALWKQRALTDAEVTRLWNGGTGLDLTAIVDAPPAPHARWNGDSVLYFTLDKVSGNRTALVGGITLADNNTVGSTTGKIGNAASFVAANNEYLSVADNDLCELGTGDFTISAWLQRQSGGGSYQVVLGKDDTTDREYALYFKFNDAEQVTFILHGTTGGQVDSAVLSLNTWYHVVVTREGSTLSLYINNGTPVTANFTGTPTTGTAAAFTIGSHGAAGAGFNGYVDEVAIVKGLAWDADAVAYDYNGGAGRRYPD